MTLTTPEIRAVYLRTIKRKTTTASCETGELRNQITITPMSSKPRLMHWKKRRRLGDCNRS
jgi:hypothetical protein